MTALHQRLRDRYGKFEGIYVNARLGESVGAMFNENVMRAFFVEQENGQLSMTHNSGHRKGEATLYGPLRIPGKVNTGIVDINLFEILAKFAEYSDDFNHEGRKTDGARYGKTFYPHTDPEPDYTEYNELFGKKGKTKSKEVEELERVYAGFDGILSITSDRYLDIRGLADWGYLCLFDGNGKIIGLLKADGYSYDGKKNIYKKDGREYLLEDVTSSTPFVEIVEPDSIVSPTATSVAQEDVATDAPKSEEVRPDTVDKADSKPPMTPVDNTKPTAAKYKSEAVSSFRERFRSNELSPRVSDMNLIKKFLSKPDSILRRDFDTISNAINAEKSIDPILKEILDIVSQEGDLVSEVTLSNGRVVSGKVALFYHLVYETGALVLDAEKFKRCNIGK